MGQRTKYLVDYDLPKDSRRKRFYRAIDRYLLLHDMKPVAWSSMSVVFTDNESFAWYVHRQALKVGGTSHVYQAERLDDEP